MFKMSAFPSASTQADNHCHQHSVASFTD